MVRILNAATVQALDGKDGTRVAKLLKSEKLKRQLQLIEGLQDEFYAEFITMLEDLYPNEFKHMLQDEA